MWKLHADDEDDDTFKRLAAGVFEQLDELAAKLKKVKELREEDAKPEVKKAKAVVKKRTKAVDVVVNENLASPVKLVKKVPLTSLEESSGLKFPACTPKSEKFTQTASASYGNAALSSAIINDDDDVDLMEDTNLSLFYEM